MDIDWFMDVWRHCTLLGERCMRQRSGPVGPSRAGVVVSYSSGERGSGLVYPGYGTRVGIARAQPMHIDLRI